MYDIIVVGAGHAGCEAAMAAANLGSKVLLMTMNLQLVAQMSCNPHMGGIAKGQIVREIDALGGYSGVVADNTMIQFRMLSRSKGPAMWSPRAQIDKVAFSHEWRRVLETNPNIEFRQDTVTDLLVENDTVVGVRTVLGYEERAKAVILTNGTFLNGKIHIGEVNFSGGRMGESSVFGLTESLQRLGFVSDRLKTGTPVRVDIRSVDLSALEEQKGDENPDKFSFTNTAYLQEQKSCWIAYTSPQVHEILRTGFDRSPMFQGRIQGVGPRYCPSIEDKLERFSDRDRHQLFLEPETKNGIEYYLGGFSSSLPEEVQTEAVKNIKGFANVKIIRPGYAIEYDYFPPTQLYYNLETRLIRNLFFAGQINGTTGYEEAAAQGLMAGINAHLKLNDKEPFILKRSDAYIGVMIDDLISKGVDEPYRMFTSRAEYRVLLRQDNADLRLSPLGYKVGLISEERMNAVSYKQRQIDEIADYVRTQSVMPEEINPYLEENNLSELPQKNKLEKVLLRPQITIQTLREHVAAFDAFLNETGVDETTLQAAEIAIKYASYVEKEQELVRKMERLESIELSPNFDYNGLQSLSLEAREKLSKVKPRTLGQASRISGVSPADISVLLVFLGR